MTKRIVLVLSLCGMAAGIGLLLVPPAAAESPGGKNLQVLPKNMPKEEIKKFMKGVAKALGVECDHCHDTNDMSKDTDRKKKAREFMRATAEFNQKMFKGKQEVSCAHCHRGQPEPKL